MSYNLIVVRGAVVGHLVGVIIVTLLWSEIMGSYNTPVTMVEIRSVKVGHEIMTTHLFPD